MVDARELYYSEQGIKNALVMPSFDGYSETVTGLHYIIWPNGITNCASHIYLLSHQLEVGDVEESYCVVLTIHQ